MPATTPLTIKTKRHLLMGALIVGLDLMPAIPMAAQTFTVIHAFTPAAGPNGTNSDGANPFGGLMLSENTLYGTSTYGGNAGAGAVFAVTTDGTAFMTPYHFTGGGDGANPHASLILAGERLFGTARYGGSSGAGTVYAVNTNGADFIVLHSFTPPANDSFGLYTNSDGAYPYAGLILAGDTLYGAGNDGGNSGHGAVFALKTNGSSFVTLQSFSSGSGGAYSASALTLSSNGLYGTHYGSLGNGTVFAIKTNGAGFTNYYAFTTGHLNGNGVRTNSDGANPHANLILVGNTLYGTTEYGGSFGNGTVFAIDIDGTGFTNLHSFAAGAYNPLGRYTNSDGANPSAGLILSGSSLYGTASAGGRSGQGTVFVIGTNSTGFSTLYHFTATPPYPAVQTNGDGANPAAGLILSGNSLYGTTPYGGSSGNGTVFRLTFAPQLSITASGTNILLTWPPNAAGFDYSGFTLQSAPAVTGTFTNIPGATSPYTDAVTGFQQFYRLSQ